MEPWKGPIADVEVDRVLNDLKRRLLKKMDEEQLALASDTFAEELDTSLQRSSNERCFICPPRRAYAHQRFVGHVPVR